MPPVSREIITDCLAFTGALAPQIDRLDGEVRARAKADPRVKILTALPGVGQYTALVMLAETGDITRFPCPQARQPGRADPDSPRIRPHRPARAHLQDGMCRERARPGRLGGLSWWWPEGWICTGVS